ncbi:PilZ domain-containing protein [Pleionea sediminis]|uniref:PilZ domain-containing protein n=1 Tax=Pleionea sediminis TaxID=2569479 RepID=UPI00118707D3|nr:PilZ domain-containing protein [Pleionea sediminis]
MTEDRRVDNRIERSASVNFEVRFKDNHGKPIKIACRSLDISKSGLRVTMEEALPVGFITELCVENSNGKLMLLFAEVRWCRKEEDAYQCGFELLDAETSDLGHWIMDN